MPRFLITPADGGTLLKVRYYNNIYCPVQRIGNKKDKPVSLSENCIHYY